MRDRVADSARVLGIEVRVQRLEQSTRTVSDAALAVGCRESEIAKSIVFVADGDPVVCVASGRHRIDAEKLADALDVAEVRQAAADEVLLEHECIWAAAGDPHSLFAVDPRVLARCTQARVVAVGED